MREIVGGRSEVGYHFEELATAAKRLGLGTRAEAERHLGAMREQFAANLERRYIPAAGTPPKTVASHGDFANRFLGCPNTILMDDVLRARFGIIAECYDAWLVRPFARRFSDAAAPVWWRPGKPAPAAAGQRDRINVLVHPRQWMARVVENSGLDAARAWAGAAYALRRRFPSATTGKE
jgi:hypothetical protein